MRATAARGLDARLLGEEALPFGKANSAAVVDETPLMVAPGLKGPMAVPLDDAAAPLNEN